MGICCLAWWKASEGKIRIEVYKRNGGHEYRQLAVTQLYGAFHVAMGYGWHHGSKKMHIEMHPPMSIVGKSSRTSCRGHRHQETATFAAPTASASQFKTQICVQAKRKIHLSFAAIYLSEPVYCQFGAIPQGLRPYSVSSLAILKLREGPSSL